MSSDEDEVSEDDLLEYASGDDFAYEAEAYTPTVYAGDFEDDEDDEEL